MKKSCCPFFRWRFCLREDPNDCVSMSVTYLPATEIEAWDAYYSGLYANASAGLMIDDADDEYAFLLPYMALENRGE